MNFSNGQLIGLGFAAFAVGASLWMMILARNESPPAPAAETSEVKPWQTLDPTQQWEAYGDDGVTRGSIVAITRTGTRIDLIEVFPPPGVPVHVYDNDGERVDWDACDR